MARLVQLLVAGSALALVGCAAGIAANAIGMAAGSARGEPRSNEHLKPAASAACAAYAARHGAAHVIDVEQRGPSKIIVWGTVEDPKGRRSFECAYGSKITGFKLRAIRASR